MLNILSRIRYNAGLNAAAIIFYRPIILHAIIQLYSILNAIIFSLQTILCESHAMFIVRHSCGLGSVHFSTLHPVEHMHFWMKGKKKKLFLLQLLKGFYLLVQHVDEEACWCGDLNISSPTAGLRTLVCLCQMHRESNFQSDVIRTPASDTQQVDWPQGLVKSTLLP